ncbi:MAG: CpXC domain-containing protein [Treponema sp.]|jgi:hypothetical protein|nr:CpXC domain-containing protein [Treponema sp.]
MKRKIPCLCENTFTVEVPEEIDLDTQGQYLEEIINGTFLNFTCTSCGKLHKPEFPITVLWPEKKLKFEVIPELDRMSFYYRKKEKGAPEEVIIGYQELADRLRVYRDDLEPMAVESLKYYLFLKAEESNGDLEVSVWYQKKSPDALEFHIHGLKENSVAVSLLPLSVYEKTADDFKKHPKGELFSSLRHKNYLSVKNMMLGGDIK